jgi:hypothetical protein
MSVGILTFHAAHNYGAMLQAYATKKAVERLRGEGHIIDFCPAQVERGNRRIVWDHHPRQWAKNAVYTLHLADWRRRYQRYEAFKNEHFNLTVRYWQADDLRKNPPDFDVYLAGSDQVWSTEHGINPIWLLDFVKVGRKIAYAPSFGTGSVNPECHDVFQKYLPLFNVLSCRESRGVELIQEMTGVQAEHVLDPTLLLSAEDWGQVSVVPAIKQPYLLVYCMEESPEFMKLVPRAAKRTGLPVVVISRSALNKFKCASRVVRDAGPAEFLGLFQHAALICTNSFHGMAFSINFRKDFISVPHTTRNSRLSGLLKLTGLERRQLTRADELDRWSDQDFHLDYEPVEAVLQQQIRHSLEFLKKALT